MSNFSQIRLYDDFFCLNIEIEHLLSFKKDFNLSIEEINKINSFPILIFKDYHNSILKHFINSKIIEEIIKIKYSQYWDWQAYEH